MDLSKVGLLVHAQYSKDNHSIKKNALFLSVNVFSTKVLIRDYFLRDCHFTWSSEPREGLPVCRAKGVPSFLSYFKTLCIDPAPGIEPATSRSAVKRSTDWANPTAKFWFVHTMQGNWLIDQWPLSSVLSFSRDRRLSMQPQGRRHQKPHLKKHRRSFKLHRFCFITLNLSNVREFFASWVLKVCISVKKKKGKGKSLSCVHILNETWI